MCLSRQRYLNTPPIWAIYQNSLRAQKPHIAANCAAIPENLIESEPSVMRKARSLVQRISALVSLSCAMAAPFSRDEIGDKGL